MTDHPPQVGPQPPECIKHDGWFVVFEIKDDVLRIFQTDDLAVANVVKGKWPLGDFAEYPGRLQLLPSIGEVVGRTFTARKRRGENQVECAGISARNGASEALPAVSA